MGETAPAPGGAWRVLIVEDDAAVADLHRRLVEAAGGFCTVGVAAGGEAAYDATTAHRPDVAIVDLAMPGGDGLGFVRRVRTEALALEVIVVTASRDPDTIREARSLGIVDYLVKPLAPERLLAALADAAARAGAAAPGPDVEPLPTT